MVPRAPTWIVKSKNSRKNKKVLKFWGIRLGRLVYSHVNFHEEMAHMVLAHMVFSAKKTKSDLTITSNSILFYSFGWLFCLEYHGCQCFVKIHVWVDQWPSLIPQNFRIFWFFLFFFWFHYSSGAHGTMFQKFLSITASNYKITACMSVCSPLV